MTVNSQTTQFIYDGDGNLVKKIKPDGSKTIYVGGIYEVDKSSGGAVTRTVTYYPGGAMRINSTLYYVLKDHLGSASVVTDASGNIVGEQRYYPFGETRFTTGTIYTDKLFTGQREMTGLGIYHYGARFYSPKLGRFLSADSIVPGYANPQALNRYSYVLNMPVSATDPSGHKCVGEAGECLKPNGNKGAGFTGGNNGGGNIAGCGGKGQKSCGGNSPKKDKPGGESDGGKPLSMPDPTPDNGDNDGSSCSQTGAVTTCEISITPESLPSINTIYYGAQIFDYGFYLLAGAYVGSKGGWPGILVAEPFFGGAAVYESLILSDIRDDIYTAAETNTPLVVQTADSVGLVVGNTGEDGGTLVNTPVAFVFTDILVFLDTGKLLSP